MLNITVDKVEGRVPVTVMHLEGELDASNYESLIVQTQALYAGGVRGVRDLLLNLENLTFVSSSGLVALHNMALIMRGETLEDAQEGWRAFHAISRIWAKRVGRKRISSCSSHSPWYSRYWIRRASPKSCPYLRMKKRPLLRSANG